MITLSNPAAVSYVGQFLRDSGYDLEHLGFQLGLEDGLFANHENLDSLLVRTDGETRIAVLARLFFVSWPVDEATCRAILPQEFLEAAFSCGLLAYEAGQVASSAALVPFRSFLIACDSCRTRVTLPDMVTGPSASTLYPARLAIGGIGETTLDLGTGSGALALEATRYSGRVVGTDISPRTLLYAEFNAALNGITNVEWRCGDAFEPVAGDLFTRIVANPPFFLSPEKAFTYCDSPLDLDGFTFRLARECSAYLQDGGFYQMICEWADLEGEPWEKRLRECTAESGCDVMVILAPPSSPIEYAEKRSKEARLMRAGGLEGYFSKQFEYLKSRKVNQVMGGMINMRKRGGASNWFAIFRTDPAGSDIGPDIRARFDALTFLSQSSGEHILLSRLMLAPGIHLDKRAAIDPDSNVWQETAIDLVKPAGLPDRLRIDAVVCSFLPLFDGVRTVGEIAGIVSAESGIDIDEAVRRCLQLARRLLQSNFVMRVQEGHRAVA